MKNEEKGITLITLVVTIIVLLILAGVTINMVGGNQGIIEKTIESKSDVEKETLIQKIQADIFEQKTIKNKELSTSEVENIIRNYGKIEENNGEKVLITSEGNYEIFLTEIINNENYDN